MACISKSKIFTFLYFILLNIFLISGNENCKDAATIINTFWDKVNNIKHGEVLFIYFNNYYCPICNTYTYLWNKIVQNALLIDEDRFSFFKFDCSCSEFSSYCKFFSVRKYPTFRLLFPVYDKIDHESYKYIAPSEYIGNITYTGDLLLAYNETTRVNSIKEFQSMIKYYICNNVYFNYAGLNICTSRSLRGYNSEYKEVSGDEDYYVPAVNHSNIQKWKTNRNKEHMEHDIIKGVLYTLKQNVSMGKDVTLSSLETIMKMLDVIGRMYKHLEEDILALRNKLMDLKYPVPYDDWIKLINGVKIKDYNLDEKNEFNFKVCDEKSLLCTFWILYHKISVFSLKHDRKNYRMYIDLITNYTKEYMNCDYCIKNFLNSQKSCYFGFCNIHSPESFVIFLWRIHNAVTLRSVYENFLVNKKLGNFTPNEKSFINVDVAFPSLKDCEECRSGKGFTKITENILARLDKKKCTDETFDVVDGFNVKNVLAYLVALYS